MECRECRLRWRRGRLCVAHFHDFLAWLTVAGIESLYWRERRNRIPLVTAYRTGAGPWEVHRLVGLVAA